MKEGVIATVMTESTMHKICFYPFTDVKPMLRKKGSILENVLEDCSLPSYRSSSVYLRYGGRLRAFFRQTYRVR